MQIMLGTLQVMVGVLFAVVGALLCYLEGFSGEQRDWPTVIIGMLLLLVGVSCILTRLVGLFRS